MTAVAAAFKLGERQHWIQEGRTNHAPGCQSKKPLVVMTGAELKERYRGQCYNYYKVDKDDQVLVCTVCQGVIEIKPKLTSVW